MIEASFGGSGSGLLISDLHASYGRLQVLRSISLKACSDEILVALGPNGAGKSTLFGAIAGIVTSTGTIEVSDQPVGHLTARARVRAGIALVPEGRRNLFSPMTVAENLELGLRFLPVAERGRMRAELEHLFPILVPRRNQQAGLMSGGEQQMLAIAVALARKPSVLLLDEPTQGLAPVVLEGLANAIRSLRRKGMTIVMAEQNVKFSRDVGDRFIVIRDGRLVNGDNAEKEVTVAAL